MKQVRQGLLGGYVSWPGGFFIPRLQQNNHGFICFLVKENQPLLSLTFSHFTIHNLKHISAVMKLGHLVDPLVFNVLWVEAYPYMVYVLYIYRQFKNSLFAMRIAIL